MTMDISSPVQFTISNNPSQPGQRVDPPGLHHLGTSSAEVWSSQGAYVQVVRRMMMVPLIIIMMATYVGVLKFSWWWRLITIWIPSCLPYTLGWVVTAMARGAEELYASRYNFCSTIRFLFFFGRVRISMIHISVCKYRDCATHLSSFFFQFLSRNQFCQFLKSLPQKKLDEFFQTAWENRLRSGTIEIFAMLSIVQWRQSILHFCSSRAFKKNLDYNLFRVLVGVSHAIISTTVRSPCPRNSFSKPLFNSNFNQTS